jgi:hypothetical protein
MMTRVYHARRLTTRAILEVDSEPVVGRYPENTPKSILSVLLTL